MEEIIVDKILNSEYMDYLNSDEIKRLYSFKEFGVDEKKYVRVILNKIWDNYLSSLDDFDINKQFRFLICDDNLISMDGDNYSFIINKGIHHIRLLTNKESEFKKHKSGYLINIDFQKINYLFLPNTLPIDGKYINGEIEPIGLFSINFGEKEINPFYENAIEIAQNKKLPFISFNICELFPDYRLKPKDFEEFVKNVISVYLQNRINEERFHQSQYEKKFTQSSYEERFSRIIINNFMECLKYGEFDSELFMKVITEYIDNIDNNKYNLK